MYKRQQLEPGNTYRFDQSEGTNATHPLLFYLDAARNNAYSTGVTTNGTPGSSGAYTQIVVSDATPLVLHYQCSSHGLMGNQIVTNTSVAGLIGSRNRSFYSSAKFALHGFFDSVRSEIIQHNVHVTLIAPGRVATDVGKNALTASGQPYGKDDRGHNKGLTSKQAARRILTAIKRKKREAVIAKWNDIAWLAVYIRKLAPRLYFFLARRIVA